MGFSAEYRDQRMSIIDFITTINAIIQEIKSIAEEVNESYHLTKKVALKMERVGGLLTHAAKFTNEMNSAIFEQFQKLAGEIKSTISLFTRKNHQFVDRAMAWGKRVINRKRNIATFQGYLTEIDIFLQELTQLFTIQGNAAVMQKIYEVMTTSMAED